MQSRRVSELLEHRLILYKPVSIVCSSIIVRRLTRTSTDADNSGGDEDGPDCEDGIGCW
jgi:hypothetical protein